MRRWMLPVAEWHNACVRGCGGDDGRDVLIFRHIIWNQVVCALEPQTLSLILSTGTLK